MGGGAAATDVLGGRQATTLLTRRDMDRRKCVHDTLPGIGNHVFAVRRADVGAGGDCRAGVDGTGAAAPRSHALNVQIPPGDDPRPEKRFRQPARTSLRTGPTDRASSPVTTEPAASSRRSASLGRKVTEDLLYLGYQALALEAGVRTLARSGALGLRSRRVPHRRAVDRHRARHAPASRRQG